MDINKVFYPNEECIKYVKEAVLEIEIVAKYPTRILKYSPFLKFSTMLEGKKCDDFLSAYVENPESLKKTIPSYLLTTGPCFLFDYSSRKRLHKLKRELYDRSISSLLIIKAQAKSERETERKKLLDLSSILGERIIYELESDLRNE